MSSSKKSDDATTGTGDGLKDIAGELINRAFNQQDFDVIDKIAHPECRYSVQAQPSLGNAEFVSFIRGQARGMPDMRIEVLDAIEDGDLVALRTSLSGTHKGELMRTPPTGQRLRIEEMVLLRFDDDGRLRHYRQESDYVEMMVQIGIMPPARTGTLGMIGHAFSSAVRFARLKRQARRQAVSAVAR
ncbi:ester cyclase [Actinomadura alba]|uniref:Ester cyclase n=1 Tax=Actinomadura alba TaxID=406431 RepID=A0ABR7LVD1_9ACTN|nr:ester cyclase [Actinomadura alba]MBC6468415.1 ester cyclase [Actinomadura alba]